MTTPDAPSDPAAEVERLRAREIVHAWIRSDACPVVAKMTLLPERIAPLIDAIEQALASDHLAGYRAAMDAAVRAALRAGYGPPSMWGAEAPAGWHLPEPCSPRDASMHDNGCVDAAQAIRAIPDPDPAQETTP